MKSPTDLHWNDRALTEKDAGKVNIADVAQRDLENAFILPNVAGESRVLEVGCGNGVLTALLRERAAFVDAFDYAENMIDQARALHGESNNRFFHDSVLAPAHFEPPYDHVVCVRVLINLRDLQEQSLALRNMAACLKPGGTLVLVEGFREGFDALNALRMKCGIAALAPAAINFYSRLDEFLPLAREHFSVEGEFHAGMFDLLTRVVYPALVGADRATGPAEFHDRILPIARNLNPQGLEPLSRLRGFVLRRTGSGPTARPKPA